MTSNIENDKREIVSRMKSFDLFMNSDQKLIGVRLSKAKEFIEDGI